MNPFLLAAMLSLTPASDMPLLGIKTNIPAWGATVMNIEGDYYFSRRLSLSLPLYWCPWFISQKYALRVFASQPELRLHLNNATTGHYLGVHGSLAWFNVKYGNYRYQDVERPLLGGGLSYGYTLPLGRNWIFDFSVGLGVASLKYERFFNTPNGAKADTRQTLYWGVDKFSISIGYILDL